MKALDLKNIVVWANDSGGPTGVLGLAEDSDRVTALVVGGTFGWSIKEYPSVSRMLRLVTNRFARFAGCEMFVDCQDARQIQFLIKIGVQSVAAVGAIHDHDSCWARCRCCSSNFLARARRDITVPSGIFAIAAISLYDMSSSSLNTITSRNSSGN